MTSKEMIKFLKKNGFIVLRQKKYILHANEKPIAGNQTTVSNHGSNLGKGLEQQILKQASNK